MTITLTIMVAALTVCCICNVITAIAAIIYFRSFTKAIKSSEEKALQLMDEIDKSYKESQEEMMGALTASQVTSSKNVN